MPIGPPPSRPEPKSGCRPVPAPIAPMIVLERRATGSLSTRWFHGLFAGKIRHFFAAGSGWPALPTASAPARTVSAAARAMSLARIGWQGRPFPRVGALSDAWPRPMHRAMRFATAALLSALALALAAAAQADP